MSTSILEAVQQIATLNKKQKQELLPQLEEQLQLANKLYRNGKGSPYSDAEYDELEAALKIINPDHPLLADTGSEEVIDADRKVKLPIDMASFEKRYVDDDRFNHLMTFMRPAIESDEILYVSTKYDGAAILLEYKDKKLISATSKGRKGIGQDCLEHVKCIPSIPTEIKAQIQTFVKAELIIPKSVFDKEFAKDYSNARNLVSGLLSSKKPDSEKLKHVGHKAHYMQQQLDSYTLSKDLQYQILTANRFDVVDHEVFDKTKGEDATYYQELIKKAKASDYAADGIIIEYNSWEKRKEMGVANTSRNPKYAIAIKDYTQSKAAQTTVNDIVWNLTKDGRYIPTIYYDEIELDGSKCSACTGNNYKYIIDNSVKIGKVITVTKAGDIIPTITEFHDTDEAVLKSKIPNTCTACKSQLTTSSVHLVCSNEECAGGFTKQVLHFLKTVGVKDVGETKLELILKHAKIVGIPGLFEATPQQMAGEGVSEDFTTKFHTNLHEAVKDIALETILAALPISKKGIGETIYKKVTAISKDFLYPIPNKEMLKGIDGISTKTAEEICKAIPKAHKILFATPAITIKVTKPKKVTSSPSAAKTSRGAKPLNLVVTGTRYIYELNNVIKDKFKGQFVIKHSSLTLKTFAVVSYYHYSKTNKVYLDAQQRKLPILDADWQTTEDEFEKFLTKALVTYNAKQVP